MTNPTPLLTEPQIATATYPPSYTADSFRSPALECDMVMKGGITSGVVYPYAITELAQKYRFRNIGGTSAGAIAAALAAAAEVGRTSAGGGFLRLAKLPQAMARGLLSLFQPSRRARPAFAVFLACLGDSAPWRKALRAFGAILRGHPLAALAGGTLGALLYLILVALVAGPVGLARVFAGETTGSSLTLLGALVLLGGAFAAVVRLATGARKALAENGFGLCSGFQDKKHWVDGRPPLVEWLAEELELTAGIPVGQDPLTFGDLWGDDPNAATDASCRRINLEMMTSNLAHGQPYRLPFDGHLFHWRPAKMAKLFPKHVVRWMEDHSTEVEGVEGLRRLPAPAQLPVVFAVRMSLSFPLLLSAVPLYAVDWGRPSNHLAKKENRPPLYERCWFSDGGLGSNFPVHFFDALLPSRPTFGINLRRFAAERKPYKAECKNVRFPSAPENEVNPEWHRFNGVLGFVLALVRLMQNWVDATQTRLPGYRDRVVHVHLTDEEGGLNLTMSDRRIKRLSERGWCAGRELVHSFDWDQHRWARYRSTLPALHHQLSAIAARFRGVGGGEKFFEFLIRYGPKPAHYPLADQENARAQANALLQLTEAWPSGLFRNPRVPEPEPQLRIMPRI